MYSITREYNFSAAHRIEGHPKCGRLHGHNYLVKVTLFQRVTGVKGMIMDYADLDKEVKPIIDAMDHRYLISHDNIKRGDPYAELAMRLGHEYVLLCDYSTAEQLSMMLHNTIWVRISRPPQMLLVEVIEAPKSSATYTEAET